MTFEDFGFDERIQKGIDEAGFKTPMPVQAQCFDLLIKNHRDIYAQSQTGTGKTAAFLLGIFQLLLKDEKYAGQKALIVVPTRELAVQIEAEGKLLGKYLDFNIGSVYGGVGYGAQEKMLEKGLDIVIGTPGRLIDFSKQRKINMKDFGFLVIDEADRLFDMGFLPDLRRILKAMKPYNERHTLLFSATLNPRVGNLAWEYMNDPGEVIIEPEKVTVDTVTQELYHVGKDEKMKLLLGVLKRDDPENAVIFTNTRHSAWEVAKRLEVNGYTVEFLMGDLPQSKRLKIVDEVKKGHHKFLVATDVAARGLHIDELEMVINYDVPLEAESYVHRIGRTARAGASGKTITMACEEYVYGLGPIEKLLGQKLPVSWAEEELLVEDKSSGMRYPPRDRYKEMGSSDGRRDGRDDRRPRHDRGPRDDRRPREDSRPREVKPPREDSRPLETRRPRNEKPDGPARGGKTPKSGKRPLDPRAAKIQSTVSSIAGGSLDDFEAKKDVRHEKPRADVRSDRSRPERGRSDEKKAKHPHPSRKPQGGKNVPKGHNADVERIGSDSSIDERLAYYRKKYGEDFQLTGAGGSSKSSGQKKKKRKKKPSAGKQGEAIKSNPPEKTLKKTDGAKAPETQVPETESKKPKKGLIGRLFKK